MRALDQFPDFELRVIGGQRSDEDWFQRIECPAGAKNYPQFVEWFRLQCQEADFALGPLVDTNFNRCKSELKFLDYSASGLTGIYSDVPSYNSIVKNGLNGLLAGNDAKSWFDALAWMIEQPASRRRLAATASSQVRRERIVAVPGGRLQDLIVDLLANAGSQPLPNRPSTSRSDREAVVGVS